MSKANGNKQILFYYPQHFNRSVNGKNPYFEPLLEICRTHNINFLLLEEPDDKTSFPINPEASRFNLFRVLVFRKLLPLAFFKNFEIREQFIGKLVRKLTFNAYKAQTVITISNSLGGFWRGYNPKARVIDYQHGIITKDQPGFFENGKVPLHISYNNKEVAVWGRGFKNVFQQDSYYTNKVHVLGYFQPFEITKSNPSVSDKIIFTLQFLPDQGTQRNKEMFEALKQTLRQFDGLQKEKTPQVFLKHHPRHNDVIDLKELATRFNFVSILSDKALVDPKDYLINVTFYSTTAFDFGSKGIPSYFLFTKSVPYGKTDFLEDYNYPNSQTETLKALWLTYRNDKELWLEHSQLVQKWSSHFFEPLNETILIDLMNPIAE